MADHPERGLSLTCYHGKPGTSRSNGTSLYKKIQQRKWATQVPIPRSLNVTGTDTDRSATYDFQLAIYSNHGPISYRFHINGNFGQKLQTFHNP